MFVWLDDMRDPKVFAPGGLMDRDDASWREIEPERDWVWVRNKTELEELFNSTEGRMEIMSFDHDLGFGEPTGYDIIKWLADKHLDRYPRESRFHTANPIGRDNMEAYDKNVRKHLLNE
ncbi:MAG: cyclic-phosphate processing receiver domain-containing protein [Candidatus Spechtbacterales bacterium]